VLKELSAGKKERCTGSDSLGKTRLSPVVIMKMNLSKNGERILRGVGAVAQNMATNV
jgi:hypothetical protein